MENIGQRSRPIMKRFFVNEEENNQILSKMRQINLESFSQYARIMLTKGKVEVIDFSKLKELRLEINRIGVNVNQIAKRVNENGDVGNDHVAECLALLQELKEQTSRLIKDQLKRIE